MSWQTPLSIALATSGARPAALPRPNAPRVAMALMPASAAPPPVSGKAGPSASTNGTGASRAAGPAASGAICASGQLRFV